VSNVKHKNKGKSQCPSTKQKSIKRTNFPTQMHLPQYQHKAYIENKAKKSSHTGQQERMSKLDEIDNKPSHKAKRSHVNLKIK